jgi:hypothetical protein
MDDAIKTITLSLILRLRAVLMAKLSDQYLTDRKWSLWFVLPLLVG